MSLIIDPYRFGGAASAPSFVAAYTDNVNSTSHTMNVPSGTTDGDLMIVALGAVSLGSVTPPSGWTLVQSVSTNTPGLFVYYRVASSEPASYSWSSGSGCRAVSATYRGTSGIDVSSVNQTYSPSTSVTATGVTTTAANCRLVFCARIDAAVSWTPAGAFALRSQSASSGNHSNGLWDDTQAAAGATGDITFTASSAASSAAVLIALKP